MGYESHGPKNAPNAAPPPEERSRPLTSKNEIDFTGPARPVLAPSPHPPGSPGRVEDMAARYDRREDLFCARDAPLADDDGYEAAESGGEFYRLRLLQAAPAGGGTRELFVTQENLVRERHRPVRPSDARTDGLRAKDAARKRKARKKAKAERQARAAPRQVRMAAGEDPRKY